MASHSGATYQTTGVTTRWGICWITGPLLEITSGAQAVPLPALTSYQVGRVGLEPTKAEPADLQSAPFAARDTDPSAFRWGLLYY
jgi:hypothetical protein